MSGSTVLAEGLVAWSCAPNAVPVAEVLRAVGLDPDTPFDPATQRCVVVDVCGTCGGKGVRLDPDNVGRAFAAVLSEGRGAGVPHLRCHDCEGRGVRWTA